MGKGGMGSGGMGAAFAFEKDPADLLELEGKEAIMALHDLTPVVTKTMQVYSEVMLKLVKSADKTTDSLAHTQETHFQEVQNLDFKLQAFQGEYDGNFKEQQLINVEWEHRMKKVEAVISGMPAWKDDIVNMIHSSKRADDQRFSQLVNRVTDAENEHALLKEDVTGRVEKLEAFKDKIDQNIITIDRRLKVLEEDMVKMVTDHAAAKKDSGVRFQGVEEQMAAIQLSFSRFNHEAKLLEATHEEFKNSTEAEHFKLNESLQLAAKERQQISQDMKFVKQSLDEGDEKLHNRIDSLQPLLYDLEELKTDLMGMRTELEQSINDMDMGGDDISSAPPPTEEHSMGSSMGPSSAGGAKGKKLQNLARVAASAASMKMGGKPGTPPKGGVAGGLSYMMNYLKERIEGITEHSIQQDHEIGDLQTKTGEIILDLMRLRKTEDEMVVMKTKIREHHDMIGRNKTDIANFQARQSEEDQQIYALIEKRAAESVKNAAMDIKGARAELMALCENNVTGIKDVKQRLAKLSGEARVTADGVGSAPVPSATVSDAHVKMLEQQSKQVAEMAGKIAVYDDKINAHEQRLTDQGAQIYDISAKVLTELDKELNAIRDDIREKTSMLHQEILVRPTEADVKEIFTALKMGMMGETASHELKMMMEQLLQASKAHLPAEPSQNALNSNGPKAQAKPAIAGTPDNTRAPHIQRIEAEASNETAALIGSIMARLDELIDRPHSCVDSLVLYNHLLTARMDELTHNQAVVLKRIGNVQREAAMAFDEISKMGQGGTESQAGKGHERAIKRLEAAVRELARMQMAQGERESVMLGTLSRESNGEVFKCLSCDNHPVPMDDLKRSSVDVLPMMASATPQTYVGRDKLNYPDRVRAAASSPDMSLSKGRVYASSPITQPPPVYQEVTGENVQEGGGKVGVPGSGGGGNPKAAIHSLAPTALSTSSQQDVAVPIRRESFAPVSDMPPPQFHTRTRDLAREQQLRSSADSLPAINPTGRGSQERPTSAS